MGKPVAGDVVVIPFPQTNLQVGKRRPALVVVDLPGDDLILCQITSQARFDPYSVILGPPDLQSGRLTLQSFGRTSRLFTVEKSVILYVVGQINAAKLAEIRGKLSALFK